MLCVRLTLIHAPLDRANIDPYSLKNGLPLPLSLLYPEYAGSALGNRVDGNNSSSYDLQTERLKNKFLITLTTCQFYSLFSKHTKLGFPSAWHALGEASILLYR